MIKYSCYACKQLHTVDQLTKHRKSKKHPSGYTCSQTSEDCWPHREKETLANLVTFGLGGHTLSLPGGHHTLSGYESPDSFLSEVKQGKYAPSYHNGNTWYISPVTSISVVDGRPAYQAKPGLSMKEPLIDNSLSGKQIETIPAVDDPIMASALSRPECFGITAQLAVLDSLRPADSKPESGDDLDKIGGFDSVSVETYVAWCRKFLVPHGARVGMLVMLPEPHYEWEKQHSLLEEIGSLDCK